MRTDPSAQINDFKRVLYFTKDNLCASDTHNPCLSAGVDDDACLVELASSYVVIDGVVPHTGQDYLTHDGSFVSDVVVFILDRIGKNKA